MSKHALKAGRTLSLSAFLSLSLFPPHEAAADPVTPAPVTIYSNQRQLPTFLGEVGSSVTVIGEEDIKNLGAVTAADALRHVPGLSVNQAGGQGGLTQMRIRGSEANHVLLMVDGVRFNDPSGFGFDYSGLLAADIERIEIIRGPQSGIYGSGAHAGVIAITTKSGKGLRKPIVDAHLEGGSFGTVSSSLFAAGGNGTTWGSLTASGLTTRGYNFATNGSEADAATIGNLQLRLGTTPTDGLDIDSSLRYGTRDADYDQDNSSNPAQPPLIDAQNPHYGQHDLAGRIGASYRAPESNLQQQISWEGYSFLRKSDDAFGPFHSEGHRNEGLYRVAYGFDTPDFSKSRHDLSVQASHEWLDYETSFQPNHSLDTTGLAAEWRTSFFDKTFVSAALRHDISQRFEDATTYRLTARHNFNYGISMHAAVGTGITNPTMNELFGSSGGFVGNPDLKPEESFEWEVGTSKTWKIIPVTFGLTYFNGVTTNEIRTVSSPVSTAVNDPGDSPRQGGEVLLSYIPMPGLSITGTYTYTYARTSAGQEEIRRPPHAGALDVSYVFFDTKAKLNVGIAYNGHMVDSDFRTFPAPLVGLDAYTLLNASLSYRVNEQVETYVKVQNALDEEYQEAFGFRGQPFSAFAGVRVNLE